MTVDLQFMFCFNCFNELTEIQWKMREKSLFKYLKNRESIQKVIMVALFLWVEEKDSYWQVHKVVELGFDPLLVTYHGNNYLPVCQIRNLDRMAGVSNL